MHEMGQCTWAAIYCCTPTANEIGAIMMGDGHDDSISDRVIIINRRNGGGLQHISALHLAHPAAICALIS